MNITGSDDRQRLLHWGEEIAQLLEPRDSAAAASIRAAADSYREHRFVLTVLGKAKRGKSTLINALLGRRDDLLAPVDQLPASSVLSRFVRGDELSARVCFRPVSSGAPTAAQAIPPSQIREYVTEEGNPDNRRQVECVEVRGPFEGFDADLTLIDTPGAGSIHEYHDEIVRAVIPQSDAVVFLVTARMPIDQDELDLLRQLQTADLRKIFFAINRIDQTPPEELAQAESHNRTLLQQAGIAINQFYRLSAKRAFEGALASSGLPELADDIRQLLRHQKSATLAERLVSRVRLQAAPLLQGLDTELALLGQTAEEQQRLRAQLTQQRSKLSALRGQTERRFELAWQQALDEMAVAVKGERGAVEQRLLQQVDGASLLNVSKVAKEFPHRIVSEVESALKPPAERMEQALRTACQELDAGYPAVDLASLGVVGAVRAKGSLVPSLIYGTTLAAGGGAALAAAQAAAASAFQVVTTQSLLGAGLSWIAGMEIPLLTSSVVPTALPAWAIVAGPVGWTLLGLGALSVPFGWSLSRVRMKEQLRDQAVQQLGQVFQFLLEDRLPLIRKSAPAILEEYRRQADQELAELEAALEKAETVADPAQEARRLTDLRQDLTRQLEAPGGEP